MIYVVHVTSGMEYETVQALVMQGIKAYAPKHHLLERRRGEWTTVSRYLFPGYVFADLPQLTDEVYYKVRNTDGVIRFLGSPSPVPLSYSEQRRMQWIFDAGVLGVSKGHVHDGKIVITSGLLLGRENDIISFSKRQKRCKLCCVINGRKHYFSLSAELD
ncbi:transcription termination/antitermination NusG family protein [Ruminococcus sp. 210702-SL.1.03]|jgi:transcription antitermination factor NusG|uniref:transcription termination/antitermination NusG family protein n=1 Tax=Ruminococcus sp. 210702-SL.1.03 TaxID=2883233 RepID=UPI001D06DF21|nr:transcription termination/antitermination NusG family protein [Ruminococcus sp. 210702-SL.1.03]MCB6616951.1 hypothetical protein [Ruminococcus sp. 210702-SL.1.03]